MKKSMYNNIYLSQQKSKFSKRNFEIKSKDLKSSLKIDSNESKMSVRKNDEKVPEQ